MMINVTFNNTLAISWRSVLLVKEIGVPRENHRPAVSHWQTLLHNVVSSTPRLNGIRYDLLIQLIYMYMWVPLNSSCLCSVLLANLTTDSTISQLLTLIGLVSSASLSIKSSVGGGKCMNMDQFELKIGSKRRCPGRLRSSSFTNDTRRVDLVTNPAISLTDSWSEIVGNDLHPTHKRV
jgi:hypothetical protein